MHSASKIAVGFIYGIGTIIVFTLILIILFRVNIVLNPHAMLPMELHEMASVWLAMGFGPMLIASILFHTAFGISESNNKKKNTIAIYTPAIICSINLLLWVGAWLIGIVNMLFFLN